MERKIKAVVFPEPNVVTLQEVVLPPCGPKELVCETLYSFVSPGTELRVLSGRQERSPFPLIPGYSWVGKVIEVGRELSGWRAGELVTGRNPIRVPGYGWMWGGQAGRHRVETAGYDAVLKLPEGADPWDYVAVEVASISWRGASIAFPAPGETAVVIGQGLIGTFNALWLSKLGARVIVVDTVEPRLARARKWGMSAAINAAQGDAAEQIRALCPDGADIVMESSSSKAGVELANKVIRQPLARVTNTGYPQAELHSNPHYWPRLVYQANYTHKVETAPGELTGGEGAIILKPGDRTVADRLAVMERVRKGELPLADIVTAPTPVEEAPQAYFALRDHPEKYNTLVFKW